MQRSPWTHIISVLWCWLLCDVVPWGHPAMHVQSSGPRSKPLSDKPMPGSTNNSPSTSRSDTALSLWTPASTNVKAETEFAYIHESYHQ